MGQGCLVAKGPIHDMAAICDLAPNCWAPTQRMLAPTCLSRLLCSDLCLSCPGCTCGPHSSVHIAAIVAIGPGSSASGVGPALCPGDLYPPGAHRACPGDQQNSCKEGELASFQQGASALPTEAPEKMEPSTNLQEASAQLPEASI